MACLKAWDGSQWVEIGGVGDFIDHSDTPANYSGAAGVVLRVNAGETAVEFNNVWIDNNAILLGTLSDSSLLYDGSDTIWDLQAAGTGDLEIQNGNVGIHVNPTTEFHVQRASSGGTVPSDTPVWVTNSGNCFLALTGGASSSVGILMGDNADRAEQRIQSDNTAQSLDFWTAGVEGMSLDASSQLVVGGGSTSPDRALHVDVDDATNSAVTQVFKLTHRTTGTAADGIGAGMEFEVETQPGGREIGVVIEAIAVDTTAGSEDFDLVFYNMAAGATASETLRLTSTGSLGIGTVSPDRPLHAEIDDAVNAGVTYAARYTHTTSGTPAAGIGTGIEFEVETAAGNNEIAATVDCVATDVTATSEDFDLVFSTMAAGGAVAERLRISSLNVITAGSVRIFQDADDNFFIGEDAGNTTQSGSIQNTGVGIATLQALTTGDNNVAIGQSALNDCTIGSGNAAIGAGSMAVLTEGDNNVGIGLNALVNLTTGNQNVAVGQGALQAVTTGSASTAVGRSALNSLTTGANNTAFGASALSNTTGAENTAVGDTAGRDITTGIRNVCVGRASGLSIAGGSNNVAIGDGALNLPAGGVRNVCIGDQAGLGVSSTAINRNICIGFEAGHDLTTSGDNNILIGYRAADATTSGDTNIAIGYLIDTPSATSSQTMTIGNLLFAENLDGTGTTIATGFAGIGVVSPARRFHVEGDNATNSGVTQLLRLTHTTSGTPAAGIGAGMEFEVETAGGNNEIGVIIEAVTTDVTATSEDFDIVFSTMAAGAAAAEKARITSEGMVHLPKTAGTGFKVDIAAPTYGFADILGDQFAKNTGATRPSLTTYNGAVESFQFGDGDEAFLTYHIPHDYVPSTDIFLHIHWSQTSATATGGTIDFKYFAIYAKGHNQASGSTFTSTPITATFSTIDINDGGSGLSQYQHHLTEVQISGASATAALFDRDDLEPDGVIELTFEMDANNLTNSVTVLDPFVHFVDLHYQTTGLIGTKDKAPDFYT